MNQTAPVAGELLDPAATELLGSGLGGLGLVLSLLLVLTGQLLLWAQVVNARLGFDANALRRYGRLLRSIGGAGTLAVLVYSIGARVNSPLTAALMLVLALALIASGTFQDALGGLYLQVRLQLREGDRIRTGEVDGEVHSLHWDHVELTSHSDDRVYVPNRLIARAGIEVQSVRRAVPLVMSVAAAGGSDLERLRDTVALMPYRVPATQLSVTSTGETVEIRCMTWSHAASRAAQRRLQRLAATGMAPAPEAVAISTRRRGDRR